MKKKGFLSQRSNLLKGFTDERYLKSEADFGHMLGNKFMLAVTHTLFVTQKHYCIR